jgi:hypothetical protein
VLLLLCAPGATTALLLLLSPSSSERDSVNIWHSFLSSPLIDDDNGLD